MQHQEQGRWPGLWEEGEQLGRAHEAEENEPRSEEEKQHLHWVRDGDLPAEGNFLGKDVALGRHGLFQKRVSPSALQ